MAGDPSAEGERYGGQVRIREGRPGGEKTAGDDDDLKAVRKAIAFEAKGAQFYAGLRDQSADPKEKAFFGLLADIEHEHFASLKDTEEFFIDPAAWYQKAQSSGLDGA